MKWKHPEMHPRSGCISGCFHFIPAPLVAERYCGNQRARAKRLTFREIFVARDGATRFAILRFGAAANREPIEEIRWAAS
jgi:hypothetical protein